MKQFLECESEFLPFMMWVDQQAAHVSEEEEGLELNTKWLNQELYCVLSLNLDRACACSGEKFGGASQVLVVSDAWT